MPGFQVGGRDIDPILLEIMWNRLISITDEGAATLVRTAFCTNIRESNDYTCTLMDANGDSIADNRVGTPSFVGCLPQTMKHFLKLFPPRTWRPGDVVITNDPWIGTGHKPDMVVAMPIFHEENLVAFAGSIAHHADIGGAPWAGDCRSVFEEGLGVPPTKLLKKGKPNKELLEIIRCNVRLPDLVIGDLFSQVAAAEVISQRVVEFLDEYGLKDLQGLSKVIQERAEDSMRRAIARIPDGTFHGAAFLDGYSHPLEIHCTITVNGDEIEVDYTGTSPQVDEGGINAVYTYTWTFTTYMLKCLLDPETYKNEGAYRPIKVHVPDGTILNADFPAAVNVRQLSGHCVTAAILEALAPIIPNQVIADSGSCPGYRTNYLGKGHDGQTFSYLLFANGGMGARPTMDGLSCTVFPSNATPSSTEIMECQAPLVVWKKEIRQDSGGAGKFQGGHGQEIIIEVVSEEPISLAVVSERLDFPPQGALGGAPGAPNHLEKLRGEGSLPRKGRTLLLPGDIIKLSFAGGGGFGPPHERDKEKVIADLRNELISASTAETTYGVSTNLQDNITPKSGSLNRDAK